MKRYVIGVDFGTLSGRAILADVTDGRIIDQEAENYRHGLITEALPDGTLLPKGFVLADPWDYEEVLKHTVQKLMERNRDLSDAVAGIGIDITCSTFVPVDETGFPLQKKEQFRSVPHAWMKMWKHHHAEKQAEKLTELMNERQEGFTVRCGSRINAEWMLPKLLEIYEEAPEVYEAVRNFEEMGDMLVRLLTGETVRSQVMLNYKMLEDPAEGPVNRAFLEAAAPGFGDVYQKLRGRRTALGTAAGKLMPGIALELGLPAGIPVASANIDAHAAYPALGITEPDSALMILGTSCCMILTSEKECAVPGIFGAVRGGVLPGYIGYEAGQSAVGDMFAWLEKNGISAEILAEASERNVSVLGLLTEKAGKYRPGESGLLALDWWNGNRSVLSDMNLSGLILGITLKTRPEEIFRALIESAAFGMREIFETFEKAGVPVRKLYVCGGIAKKNGLLLQIYADILKKEIHIGASDQCSALGAAIYGAAAAGCYDSVINAAVHMGHTETETVKPHENNSRIYDLLFDEYRKLHDYFGRGGNNVMKHLKGLREK